MKPLVSRRRIALVPAILALLALAPACDDDSGPAGREFSPVTGMWIGTEFDITFTFDITESESGDLSGLVLFEFMDDMLGGGNIISGRREGEHVVMVVDNPGHLAVTFHGDLSTDDRMVLETEGFGFVDEEQFRLDLRRQ